ncbi:unannotated protein [freshwater metagenome]|uniref:Unannotated protein n=1 Tax=freshwater metagenome TaxID=449393 RepID=A0A6J6IK03_9ZZZZ
MSSSTGEALCVACASAMESHDASKGPSIKSKNHNDLVRSAMRVQDTVADKVTSFAGSLNFVYLHGLWFGLWIALNIGLIGAGLKFDSYPFSFLTLIVSLEAIFLSTFVMVSQNRHAKRDAIRADIGFETDVRSEMWSLHIGAALGIDPSHVEASVKQAVEAARVAQEKAESAT